MKLTFKRREVKDLQHLGTLVAENAEAIEPGLQILASNLNLGRTSVELAAIDSERVPVLITLGLTADDALLVRAMEAYAWCLEDPESVHRLMPATVHAGWPPRVVFVAERLLESFVRKLRLLKFAAVDCFEFRYVEANGTTGFYLERVEWAPSAPGSGEPAAERLARPEPLIVEPLLVPREEATLVLEPTLVLEEPAPVLREEPKVVPLEEPKIARLEEPEPEPLEEPRIVMLHEPKAVPRIVEPAATNGGISSESTQGAERSPVLKGLRPPTELLRGRKPRDAADILRIPLVERTPTPREAVRSPDPPAPAATRGSHVEAKPAPAADPRAVPRNGASKNDPSRNDLARSEGPRGDVTKGDLAPTWRKFLDRLTSTFDTRPEPAPPAPRPSTPPAPRASIPPEPAAPLVIQPFAADLKIAPHEVAPDEPDTMPDLSDKQRSIIQGLTLPDNGELAPQWRKFLDHPALDETKIAAVRGYLQREFPLCTVYDFYDFQRNAQVFQLQDNHGKVTQLITMTAEFFDTHRDMEIRAWIEKHRLAQAMRQAGQAGVLVSQAGLQIEKR